MKANELRIGNIISFKSLWQGEVSDISSSLIQFKGNKGLFDIDSLVEIKITPEILESCGFENDSYAVFSKKLPKEVSEWAFMMFYKEYELINLSENIRIADYDLTTPCKYVHQLQNLYFSLTGEELEITL